MQYPEHGRDVLDLKGDHFQFQMHKTFVLRQHRFVATGMNTITGCGLTSESFVSNTSVYIRQRDFRSIRCPSSLQPTPNNPQANNHGNNDG
jgi:hypothetical protein